MKNIYLITILTLFISNCGEKVREEITERFDNGDKELFVKYKGEGSDEVVVERITYSESGDTLLLEKPLDKIYMERLYLNGQIQSEANYKDGKNDGNQITYYENGKKESEVFFKDGEEDGKRTEYYENGQKLREGTVKDGEYYVINGWNKDGKLLVKDGNGKWTSYDEDGQKKEEMNYKDGKMDGKAILYDEDGNKLN